MNDYPSLQINYTDIPGPVPIREVAFELINGNPRSAIIRIPAYILRGSMLGIEQLPFPIEVIEGEWYGDYVLAVRKDIGVLRYYYLAIFKLKQAAQWINARLYATAAVWGIVEYKPYEYPNWKNFWLFQRKK